MMGYKKVVKEGLKVIKIKPRNQGNQDNGNNQDNDNNQDNGNNQSNGNNQGNNGNQSNKTNESNQDIGNDQGSNDQGNGVDDRKTVVEQMNEMISQGTAVINSLNPVQMIINANSNGGTQTANQVMNNMVTQIQAANQITTGIFNQAIVTGEGIATNIVNVGTGGSARLSGSPAAMDALRDIQKSLNGIEGIARAIRDIFSEEPGNSQIFK